MKKNWTKRALSVGLALTMAAGLCACGGSTGTGGTGSSSGGRGNGSTANAAMAKENVYKVQEITLPQFIENENGFENGYVNIAATEHRDGKVYLLMQVEDYSKEGSNSTSIQMLVMNEDGTDQQVIPLQMPSSQDREEQTPGDSPAEPAAPAEGGAEVMPLEGGDSAVNEGTADEAMVGSDTWEYTGYSNFAMSSEGRILCVKDYNFEDYSNPEQYISEQHEYICCWDSDGTLLWETELEELRSQEENAEWIYVNKLSAAKDGSVNLLLMGENAYKLNVSRDGEISDKVQLSEESYGALNNNQNMILREDGTFLIMYSDENDWTKQYLVSYDMDTDTLGEPSQMPGSISWNGYNTMDAGINSDLVYSNSNGVYTYNVGDADGTKHMDFINSDVNITSFRSLVELSADSFMAVYYENYGNEMKAGIFTYVDPKDIPDKAVIVLAGNYLASDVKQRVVEYNRSSDAYRIVVKEYSSYSTYEDYEGGYKQLNNEIITGGMPDILMTEGLPMENYISKGLIADVGKLIEQDEELSQVEFLRNVFDAYSVNGTLYYVIPQFSVNTMIAKTALVGDRTGWTMEEMQQVLAGMGEDAQAISEATRSGFMGMAMYYCGSDFIDVASGKCSFDSDNFIAMMEFAKTLPEEIDWDGIYGDEDYWENYDSQYRMNRTLMMNMYIGSFSNISYYINGSFGEPVSFVGFPTDSGKGSYINANMAYALSAKSENLEGAWDFIRYYLTDEYQETLDWGLPVNEQLFLEKSKEATKRPTYTDENGQKVEYDETFYMNGEEIVIPPLTQEQVDQVVEFIQSVDVAMYYNEDVLNIINEEMDAFYTGQKSARDVAAIIQSRAQIFVDENR